MSRTPSVSDPYRVLGVPRDADDDAIKAAHRKLAKRYHPDAGGDEQRFLAVQDAYQLLSDPVARGDWDRRHAPGPVRARERSRPRSRATSSRWTREDTAAYRRGRSKREKAKPDHRADGSGRDPRRHHHTWSAEGVPWWEDFVPKGATPPPERDDTATPGADDRRKPDFDVYDRSSGAAWSMAARRHFRRGDADLPSRGFFRYRGTQVVTGAEARKVAAEEAAAEERATRAAANAAEATNSRPPAPEPGPSTVPPAPPASAPPPPPSAAPRAPSGRPPSNAAGATAPSATKANAPASGSTPADAKSIPPADVAAPATEPATAPAADATLASAAAASAAQASRAADADDLDRSASDSGSATPAIVGAFAAPTAVLLGANAAGALDGAPSTLVVLLLVVTVVAGGAVGRALGARTAGR